MNVGVALSSYFGIVNPNVMLLGGGALGVARSRGADIMNEMRALIKGTPGIPLPSAA